MVAGGGGCGCSDSSSGGGDSAMGVVVTFVVVTLVVAVVSPVAGQIQGVQQGRFQLHSSCGSKHQLRYLVVNDPMWLRTGEEELTLFTSTTNNTCRLPPRATLRVTAHISLEVKEVSASEKGEGKEATTQCFFPKQDLSLSKGLLRVSCLKERGEAEVEMLGDLDSVDDPTTTDSATTTLDANFTLPASIATTPATTATTRAITATLPISRARVPEGRDLDLTFSPDATQPTASTAGPPDTHELLATQPTARSAATTEGATSSSRTTTTVTEPTTSSGKLPTDGVLTVPTPGGSTTQEAGRAGTPTTPSGKHKSLIKEGSIVAAEPVSLSNASQTDGDKSGMSDDQVLYLAGAGAGVLALVLGVVVVAGLAHHRRRQAIAASRKEDLFISGGYRGSMNSLTPTGNGGNNGDSSGGRGAYLNANVMYYSGADPEVAESFEMEERALSSSGISYSSHDIPKCLRE